MPLIVLVFKVKIPSQFDQQGYKALRGENWSEYLISLCSANNLSIITLPNANPNGEVDIQVQSCIAGFVQEPYYFIRDKVHSLQKCFTKLGKLKYS